MSTTSAPEAGRLAALDRRSALRPTPRLVLRDILRFAGLATAVLLVAYAVLFFPHPPQGAITRALQAYLRGLATVVGGVLALAGEPVSVQGDVILGRFPLRIVLDCAALEAQTLLVAFVVAFPAPWRPRLVGVLAGVAALTAANVVRIIVLYFVGTLRPDAFRLVHEEVMQIALVLTAAALFAAWISWTRRRLT